MVVPLAVVKRGPKGPSSHKGGSGGHRGSMDWVVGGKRSLVMQDPVTMRKKKEKGGVKKER